MLHIRLVQPCVASLLGAHSVPQWWHHTKTFLPSCSPRAAEECATDMFSRQAGPTGMCVFLLQGFRRDHVWGSMCWRRPARCLRGVPLKPRPTLRGKLLVSASCHVMLTGTETCCTAQWFFPRWGSSRFVSFKSIMPVFFHESGLLCWQQLRISPCSSKTTLGSLHLT